MKWQAIVLTLLVGLASVVVNCSAAPAKKRPCRPLLVVESAKVHDGILSIEFAMTNRCEFAIFVVHQFSGGSSIANCAMILTANRPGFVPRIRTTLDRAVLIGSDLGNVPNGCNWPIGPFVEKGEIYRGTIDVQLNQLGLNQGGQWLAEPGMDDVELELAYFDVGAAHWLSYEHSPPGADLVMLITYPSTSDLEKAETFFEIPKNPAPPPGTSRGD